MKKILLSLSILFLSGGFAVAANSVADMSGGPAKSETDDAELPDTSIKSRRVKSDANLYYISKDKRSVGAGTNSGFAGCGPDGCYKIARSVRSELKKSADNKKYNLSNPFYQPMESEWTLTGDLTYNYNALDFEILTGSGAWQNHTGTYSGTTTSGILNLAYGINDKVSAILMGRFAATDLNIHWNTVTAPFDNDDASSSDLDLWGAGLQWRVMNDDNSIGTVSASYQSLKDSASIITADAKFGYKQDNTTFYGFGRLQFINWDGEGYGFGLKNQYDQTEFFTLDPTAASSLYYELGGGMFAAIDTNWSADLSLTYSDAEWHQFIYSSVALSYQPWKNTAISFFARANLWDNADQFNDSGVYLVDNLGVATREGTASFGNYTDLAAGVRITTKF